MGTSSYGVVTPMLAIGSECAKTGALNLAVAAKTQWYAARQGEQLRRCTLGDSLRQTNDEFLDTRKTWRPCQRSGGSAQIDGPVQLVQNRLA